MLLEYFQMIDRVESLDLDAGRLTARSVVPKESPVFEGHFPGMPLVPGVLLIETMAQASGFIVLARTDFAAMPFLMSVDKAKMRDFVEPGTPLTIHAELVHEGSGYAVAKARIEKDGKRVADTELKLRVMAADRPELAAVVRRRAEEIGLLDALNASHGQAARME